MPAPQYSVPSATVVSLTGGTARTIIGAKAHANSGLLLLHFSIGFADTSSAEVPGTIQICYATFATNPPGTQSTSITPIQTSGRVMTAGFTAASHWVAANEPTVLTPLRTFPLTPNGGTMSWDFPLGTEFDSALGEGFAIRCNYATATDVWATLGLSRS